ncbi:hypothetical protein BC833DRAFT_19671 [Globomyces pollinis-pini]|nr:hypothetical protein BC833DRAFT_19671 [Globomyces pollinis-pini]
MMNRDFGSFIQISSHSPAIVENLVIQKFSPWTPDISPSNGPDIVNPIDTRTPSDPDVKPISFNPSGADEPDNSRSAGIDQTVPVPSGEQITSVGSNGQSGPISNNDPTIAMNQQAQTSQDAASASGNPIPVDNQSTASSDAVSSGITLPANNGVNSTNQAAAVSNNSGTACQMSLILLCCHLFYIIL